MRGEVGDGHKDLVKVYLELNEEPMQDAVYFLLFCEKRRTMFGQDRPLVRSVECTLFSSLRFYRHNSASL